MRLRRKRTLQYLIPITGVSLSSFLVTIARGALPENTPYLFFFIPVALSAGAGGLLPGLLATGLSAVACDLLLVPPLYVMDIRSWTGLPLALFILISLLVSAFSELLHLSYRHAEAARHDAVIAHQRINFLAEASVALDSSLDYSRTLAAFARFVVPGLADWCAVEVADEATGHVLFAAAHIEPDKENLIAALDGQYPQDALGVNPVQKVLNTGQPVMAVDIRDSALMESARDSEHLRILRLLAIRSYVAVPLKARGRILGAMILVSGARRRYSSQELALVEDLAKRASLAVDNARLYEEVQRELKERERTQAALLKSQADTVELNEKLKRSVTETHHRVKNNLQVIAAMVDMLLMQEGKPVSHSDLERLGSQIRTLAALHDVLTHETKADGGAQGVPTRLVLEKLLGLLRESTTGRELRYAIDDVQVTPKQNTSLALLVNELVSNAIKHGLGAVEVTLRRQGNEATLEVCDEGPGFPAGFEPDTSANTGLDLVDSLSRWDLLGEVDFLSKSGGGARVVIRFPTQDSEVSTSAAEVEIVPKTNRIRVSR